MDGRKRRKLSEDTVTRANNILLHSCWQGDHEGVTSALRDGASACSEIDSWLPLHVAAMRGDLTLCKILVQHGAKCSQLSVAGATCLHSAAPNGHLEVVKFLVENGCPVDREDNRGVTPLKQAAWSGCAPVVEWLTQHGADPNHSSSRLMTPLHVASMQGYEDVVVCLLRNGADPNRRDDNGETPLVRACENGHGPVATFLLKHGAQAIEPAFAAAISSYLCPKRDRIIQALLRGKRDFLTCSTLTLSRSERRLDQSTKRAVEMAFYRDRIEVLLLGRTQKKSKSIIARLPQDCFRHLVSWVRRLCVSNSPSGISQEGSGHSEDSS